MCVVDPTPAGAPGSDSSRLGGVFFVLISIFLTKRSKYEQAG